MHVRFYIDPETDEPHIFEHFKSLPAPPKKERKMKKPGKKTKSSRAFRQKFPPGWDEERVRKVLAHCEGQSEEEAVAQDEAAYEAEGQTVMIVPTDLVPAIRRLLARRRGA